MQEGPIVVVSEFVLLAANRLAMIQEAAYAISGAMITNSSLSAADFRACRFYVRKLLFAKIPPGHQLQQLPGVQKLVLMGGAELVRYSRAIANEKLVREFTAAGKI